MRRLLALTILAVASTSGTAFAAGPPVMPLSQVTPGMDCTATTVVQGTTLSTFDVHVIDIVSSGGESHDADLILFRASGPVVDPTGIAEGYSGSPIWCPGPGGTPEIAGAVSYGSGDYGNLVAMATPIQSVLGTPVSAPQHVRVDPALMRTVRPLATPLTVTGLSTPIGDALVAAAKTRNIPLHVAPVRARDAGPAPTLVPGASIATMYSSGAIGAGAVGTVTYVDGNKVWAFGHPLEGVGQRSLLMDDAYVYTVINEPAGTAESSSYKLAAPGRDVGTLTWDGNDGVAGLLGVLPARIPLEVAARDEDRKTAIFSHSTLADERALDLPGMDAISLIPPSAVADAMYRVMNGSSVAQTATMCISIAFKALPQPVRVCNDYVGGGRGADGLSSSPLVSDVAAAVGDISAYRFGTPVVSSIKVSVDMSRGFTAGELRTVVAPPVVRRGRIVPLVVRYQELLTGKMVTRTVRVRIPVKASPGTRELVLSGTDLDSVSSSSSGDLSSVFAALLGSGGGTSQAHEPHTLAQLVKQIRTVKRTDGVSVRLRGLGGKAGAGASASATGGVVYGSSANPVAGAAGGKIAPILVDPKVRITGKATTIVVVR